MFRDGCIWEIRVLNGWEIRLNSTHIEDPINPTHIEVPINPTHIEVPTEFHTHRRPD